MLYHVHSFPATLLLQSPMKLCTIPLLSIIWLAWLPFTNSCNCDGCPSQGTRYLGTYHHWVSPVCPSGHVASVKQFRILATQGSFELVIWNEGTA